jgi:chemotaxis protein CheD
MHSLGKTLPGFENINRYWDITHKLPAAKILPGEYYVTKHDEIITTVLGSCVSACIWDTVFKVGGMNHFMLPLSDNGKWGGSELLSKSTRYGNYAMEHMINDILKHGGSRQNLAIKIFGGGRKISDMSNIGSKNIEFIHNYINNEGLSLFGEDTGDIYPRKVVFYPTTGRVRIKKLKQFHNNTIIQREKAYQHDIEDSPIEGSIELF